MLTLTTIRDRLFARLWRALLARVPTPALLDVLGARRGVWLTRVPPGGERSVWVAGPCSVLTHHPDQH